MGLDSIEAWSLGLISVVFIPVVLSAHRARPDPGIQGWGARSPDGISAGNDYILGL